MKRILIRFIVLLKDTFYKIKREIAYASCKVDAKTILFDSFAGKFFNDNPFAIFEGLYQQDDYTLVYALKDEQTISEFKQKYPKAMVVKHHSFKHFQMLKIAKLWIFNYKSPHYFKKLKTTNYLQTWHGIPLKKLGCDLEPSQKYYYRSLQTYQQMIQSYIDEGHKCDYFIVPSLYATKHLQSAFQLNDDQLLQTLYPRNLKLVNYQDNDIVKIKNDLKIPLDKKIILYAPTWRDDTSSLFKGYLQNYVLDFNHLTKALGDDYYILYRPHYLIKDQEDLSQYKQVIDVANYADIADLYLIADCLITDYSSVYFDYAILKRPMYFYMPDLANYQDNLRGFYIDINQDLPNDYHTNQDDLVQAIKDEKINETKFNEFFAKNIYYNYNLNISNMVK